MQYIIKSFKNIQAFSLIVGIVFGVAGGLLISTCMMSKGSHMSDARHKNMESSQVLKNENEIVGMHDASSENHYVMNDVTSEKQFVQEMKLHHEAAVIMAQQVLALPGIRPEVRDLAKDIISTQITEIKMMKDWITSWK